MKQNFTGKIVKAEYKNWQDCFGLQREILELEIQGNDGSTFKYKVERPLCKSFNFDDEIYIEISNEKVIEKASI